MKRTYIFPQVSVETLNTQSAIMAGSAPTNLIFKGKTSTLGGETIQGD